MRVCLWICRGKLFEPTRPQGDPSPKNGFVFWVHWPPTTTNSWTYLPAIIRASRIGRVKFPWRVRIMLWCYMGLSETKVPVIPCVDQAKVQPNQSHRQTKCGKASKRTRPFWAAPRAIRHGLMRSPSLKPLKRAGGKESTCSMLIVWHAIHTMVYHGGPRNFWGGHCKSCYKRPHCTGRVLELDISGITQYQELVIIKRASFLYHLYHWSILGIPQLETSSFGLRPKKMCSQSSSKWILLRPMRLHTCVDALGFEKWIEYSSWAYLSFCLNIKHPSETMVGKGFSDIWDHLLGGWN